MYGIYVKQIYFELIAHYLTNHKIQDFSRVGLIQMVTKFLTLRELERPRKTITDLYSKNPETM